jgi:hypothetical protein
LHAVEPNGLALSYFSSNAERDWQFDANAFEQVQLRDHVSQCGLGRFNQLRRIAEALDAFLAPRFVSVLAALLAVGGVAGSLGV